MLDENHRRLVAGAIVLAHDGIGPGARRGDCLQTASFVALAATHARAHDLSLASL